MKQEPVINAARLLDFLSQLPLAIRITERRHGWLWQVVNDSGQTDDLESAVYEAISSLTSQIILEEPNMKLHQTGIDEFLNDLDTDTTTGSHRETADLPEPEEPSLEPCPYCKQWHQAGTIEQCPLKPKS